MTPDHALRRLGAGQPLRLLTVLAHPDDETLGLGGRLGSLGDARFVTVTDGAPLDAADQEAHGFPTRESYRLGRRRELEAALATAGLPPGCAAELQLPDGSAVPDQRASFHLAALALAVRREVNAFQPDAVLTHPYEGGHPDHDACAFAVHAAVRDAAVRDATRDAVRGAAVGVPILEAPFYHQGPHGMETGCFLGDPGLASPLDAAQQRLKRAALACFVSQGETLRQFGTAEERFRIAPAYSFTHRPHPGRLFYEHFSWGMDGEHFCRLAAEASAQLQWTGANG